jgi:hypothetical protein
MKHKEGEHREKEEQNCCIKHKMAKVHPFPSVYYIECK